MKKVELKDFKHNMPVILSGGIPGKLIKNNDYWYVCQNKWNGHACVSELRKPYRYSWVYYNECGIKKMSPFSIYHVITNNLEYRKGGNNNEESL